MKKEVALNKIHEALALLEESFREEIDAFNTFYADIETLKKITSVQDEKIACLEAENHTQEQKIIYLENKLDKQQEKNERIVRILMED